LDELSSTYRSVSLKAPLEKCQEIAAARRKLPAFPAGIYQSIIAGGAF
jgi:hypothetical protein